MPVHPTMEIEPMTISAEKEAMILRLYHIDVNRHAKLTPLSASNVGSDAVLVVRGLSGANDAGLKEVDLPSAVHLAFYKLELGDLPLCLSI